MKKLSDILCQQKDVGISLDVDCNLKSNKLREAMTECLGHVNLWIQRCSISNSFLVMEELGRIYDEMDCIKNVKVLLGTDDSLFFWDCGESRGDSHL